jgi:hypothetical protein
MGSCATPSARDDKFITTDYLQQCLASTLVENLRRQSIILPAMNAIERASAEAITRANRSIHAALADSLIPVHRQCLDELLKRKDGSK